ncbi:hypothetical protein PROFUN_13957 [Planoprotostelium fungivorum]|uniref:non-specific serine/threonine protein kinase n=1 Tax=Planoprotostelium fungivorum TaxID=1890364 RepID=A0A2P6N2H9_9EUKA|nr:hypothetical protein PROFUN_13957 [Planoprotostelium fungivorum]
MDHPSNSMVTLQTMRQIDNKALEIKERVGRGGFGTIYRASSGETDVILKTMMKTPSRSMEPVARKEYDFGMKLKHPNLVRMRGSFDTATDHCLVMDLVEGCNLYDYLQKNSYEHCAESRAKKMFRGIAKGLEHSHRQGIAHLDIKPENIMVGKDDHLTLIDFGLAAETLGLCHQFSGSADYASPEVWRNMPFEPSCADVWSLGIVLHILLTGCLPFDPLQVQSMRVQPDLYWPEGIDVSDDAKELVGWMLELKPMARPTMKEVLTHRWLKRSTSFFNMRRWSINGKMEGKLFLYNGKHAAFMNGDGAKIAILISGLTEGLLNVHYSVPLTEFLKQKGWSTVHTLLSSSYMGFGYSSLDNDVQEIDQLIDHLYNHMNAKKIVLIGHSTGCQDAVHFLKKGKNVNRVSAIVLQSPTSDREYFCSVMTSEDVRDDLEECETAIRDGRGHHFFQKPNAMMEGPMTYYRWHSLLSRDGDDDYFSSDLSDDERRQRIGRPSTPALIVYSLSDEYVPSHVNGTKAAEAIAACFTSSRLLLLPNANHALEGGEYVLFFDELEKFLNEFVSCEC